RKLPCPSCGTALPPISRRRPKARRAKTSSPCSCSISASRSRRNTSGSERSRVSRRGFVGAVDELLGGVFVFLGDPQFDPPLPAAGQGRDRREALGRGHQI